MGLAHYHLFVRSNRVSFVGLQGIGANKSSGCPHAGGEHRWFLVLLHAVGILVQVTRNQMSPERTANTPPPTIACARVIQYAVLDSTVEYAGRTLLFVDGRELGRVPCLAICEDKQGPNTLLFHCREDWSFLGCSAHSSVADAMSRAESIYNGVANLWVQADVSEQMANEYLNQLFENQRCSVCGRRADEVQALIERDSVFVCDGCIG
jgi:hypothetical protein